MATRVKILTSQNVIGTSAVSSGSDVYSTGAVNSLIGGIVTTGEYLPLSGGSLTGSIYSNTANGGIFGQSIDGSDGLVVSLASTSGQSSTRGGYISVKGNEVTTTGGDVFIEAGNSTLGSGEVKFSTGNILRGYFTKAGKFVLNTNDQGQATYVNTSNDISHSTLVSGDQQGRTAIYPGKIEFGQGGTTLRDTNLYRYGADELKTDDTFIVGGFLKALNTIYTYGGTGIFTHTNDGADISYQEFNGGGGSGNGRGASVVAYGNDNVTYGGNLYLNTGATSGSAGDVVVSTGSGGLTERMRITKTGNTYTSNSKYFGINTARTDDVDSTNQAVLSLGAKSAIVTTDDGVNIKFNTAFTGQNVSLSNATAGKLSFDGTQMQMQFAPAVTAGNPQTFVTSFAVTETVVTTSKPLNAAEGIGSTKLIQFADSLGLYSETVNAGYTSIVYDSYKIFSTESLSVDGTLVIL